MVFLLGLISFAFPLQALQTSYLQIQEPNGWNCERTQSEYICRSNNPIERKEALLVVKAKLAGREDNINSFYESLRRPLTMQNSAGKSGLSKVYSAEKVNLQNHSWVRSLHLNAKTANYFTEYLVTLNGDLAIGLELSYHQNRYNKYKNVMSELIQNMQLIDNIATQTTPVANTKAPRVDPTSPFLQVNNEENSSPFLGLSTQFMIYIGVGLLLIFGFLLLRK